MYDVRDYDVDTTGGKNATLGIQAALDANTDGGTVFMPAGTYLLEVQGANPYQAGNQCCLEIKNDNTALFISPGAVLRLADGQQTDAGGAVDMIIFSARSRVHIYGGGRVTGNTAGQAGWSGGYAQINNGCIIRGFGAYTDILIENLQLDDHFSNPVNLGKSPTRGSRVILRNLYGFDCGEGFQCITVDDLRMENLTYRDISDVAVGDGIEISDCADFSITKCNVSDNGAGSAFDLFGSRNGVLSDFVVNDWSDGIGLATTSGGTIANQIVISNGVIRACRAANTIGNPDGGVAFHNVSVYSCAGTPFQFLGRNTHPEVTLSGCMFSGNSQAGLVYGDRTVKFDACHFSNCTDDSGLRIMRSGSSVPDVQIVGGSCSNNSKYGIEIDGQGSLFEPTVFVDGVDLRNNDLGTLVATNNGTLNNVTVGSTVPQIAGASGLSTQETMYELTGTVADPAASARSLYRVYVPDATAVLIDNELLMSDANLTVDNYGMSVAEFRVGIAKQGQSRSVTGLVTGTLQEIINVGSGDSAGQYDWTPTYAVTQVSNDSTEAQYDVTTTLNNAGTNVVRVNSAMRAHEWAATGSTVSIAPLNGLSFRVL
jgi:hypothetical protein